MSSRELTLPLRPRFHHAEERLAWRVCTPSGVTTCAWLSRVLSPAHFALLQNAA